MSKKTALIACGVFSPEFKMINAELRERFEPVFLDSMLHLEPSKLDEGITDVLQRAGGNAVILYGDCSPLTIAAGQKKPCLRTPGSCCCEIMLGKQRYGDLMRGGSFFLMPEWVDRWEEIFKVRLGFGNGELAASLMADTMKEIVYLDSGVPRPSRQTLAVLRNYLGLPLRIETVGIGFLEEALSTALREVQGA